MYREHWSVILHILGLIGNLNLPPCVIVGDLLHNFGIGGTANSTRVPGIWVTRCFSLKQLSRGMGYSVAERPLGTVRMKAS